jgi:hypothetical protein
MAEPSRVDGRHKAGHDGGEAPSTANAIRARMAAAMPRISASDTIGSTAAPLLRANMR